MTYRWVAIFLFAAGALLALGAMILGPFGYEGPSVAAGGGACVLAVLGLYPAFASWDEPEDPPAEEEAQQDGENSAARP